MREISFIVGVPPDARIRRTLAACNVARYSES